MKMNDENDNKTDKLIAELERHLRDVLPIDCVSAQVFFDSTGFEFEYTTRSAVSLKADGISMRNLRGDFIK
jgi:hypothetical protein